MSLWRTLAATLFLVPVVTAGERPLRREVSVCMNPGANGPAVFRAQAAASGMFAATGVRLVWQGDPGWCATHPAGIVIRLIESTPADLFPGALAYAMPYEGRTIVVLYDRVRAANVPSLLTHVLVHELTHLVQGVAVHSATFPDM